MAEPTPDLVQRACNAPPNYQRWLADSAAVPTIEEGIFSLTVILDVFSRCVVSRSMQAHLRTELDLAALGE